MSCLSSALFGTVTFDIEDVTELEKYVSIDRVISHCFETERQIQKVIMNGFRLFFLLRCL